MTHRTVFDRSAVPRYAHGMVARRSKPATRVAMTPGEFVFVTVVVVTECVFTTLLCGLVGASFPGMFLPDGWGWSVGAVLGLSTGVGGAAKWITAPGPNRRKSRKKRDKPPRSMRDVLKRAAGLGILGLLLGGMVGGGLAVSWFSIAVSPFAPTGWREGLRTTRVRAEYRGSGEHRPERSALTTDNPLPWILAFSPSAAMALFFGVGGLICGIRDMSRAKRPRPETSA